MLCLDGFCISEPIRVTRLNVGPDQVRAMSLLLCVTLLLLSKCMFKYMAGLAILDPPFCVLA